MIEKVDTFCEVVLGTTSIRMHEITFGIKQDADKYYKSFNRPKRGKDGKKIPGKSRPINNPCDELKSIQQRINSYITANIKLPTYVHGGRKGTDNIHNARTHMGKKYVMTTDLHDFFTRVRHADVYAALVDAGFTPDIASIITKLTTFKGHLPQGGPASTTLANLVFAHKTGSKILPIIRDHNLTFTTFVDDITISSQQDFKDVAQQIIDIIKTDFPISHKKTHYQTSAAQITGIKVYNNHIEPADKIFDRLEDKASLPQGTVNGLENYLSRVRAISKEKKQ